jgi:hypothetical protein
MTPSPVISSAGQNRAEAAARSVDAWLTSHWKLFLAAAVVLCGLTFAGYSHAKQIWIDETLQMLIAGQPTAQQTWEQLRDGYIQVDPPMLHMLQHFLLAWLGYSVQVARIPAILGFCLMCWSLAVLVARHAPKVYAVAAFFLPYATVLRSRAMDARPYGVLAGFTALTLLCWDGMQGESHRRAWRAAFTVSAAIMFCSHFYSILFLLPLAAGEAAKLLKRRRIDWAVPACIAISLIPFLFSLPIAISASRKFMQHYFYRAAFANLYDFFSFAMASLPIAGALIALLIAQSAFGVFRAAEDSNSESGERHQFLCAAAAGFLLIPFAGYAAGALITGFFVPYYHMMSTIGVIMGLPLLVSGMTGRNRLAGLCLLVAIGGHGLFVTARGLSGFRRQDAGYPQLSQVRRLIAEPNPDIVVPSPTLFLPWQFVTRGEGGNNLIYLFDRDKGLAALGTDTADLLYSYLRRITSARIEPFDQWVFGHKRFYMAVAGTSKGVQEWQYDYLMKQKHASFWWLGKSGDFDIYRVDQDDAPEHPGR